MKKVYCLDCKHIDWNYIGCCETIINSAKCNKTSIIEKDCFGIPFYKKSVYCRGANKDCNCSDYERKWWKFWVKK